MAKRRIEDYSISHLTGGLLFSVLRSANVDRCQAAYFKLDHWTYLDLLAEVLGVNLGHAAAEKFNEVSEHVGFPDRIPLVRAREG